MTDLSGPPVLSTPDDHLFEQTPSSSSSPDARVSTLSPNELSSTYEIPRSAREILDGQWSRVALQFPDHMLVDAPRVVEALRHELDSLQQSHPTNGLPNETAQAQSKPAHTTPGRKIFILADTSYSACCVDEIAAEHVDAHVVVHYGRTCLSPTSRIPVIHVYTHHQLNHEAVVEQFEKEFVDKDAQVAIMADLTYHDHVADVVSLLKSRGYTQVVGTEVARDPSSIIPNRRLSEPVTEDKLRSYALFHIADPPSSLLLALSSRFASLHVLSSPSSATSSIDNPTIQTASLLRRRFARLLHLTSASTIGILVNTLSVSNYLSSIESLRAKIAKAGKKSYTVVVGKLNPAKLANFAEVDGWVVVGCWESGLVEDESGQYWKAVVTPFELEVALTKEEERTWGGEWWGGLEKLKVEDGTDEDNDVHAEGGEGEEEDEQDDDESAPPEFDLRTGKLIQRLQPARARLKRADPQASSGQEQAKSLIQRTPAGEVASINGVFSPGAEFLRTKRTWQGLGSDFVHEEGGEWKESTTVEEGRGGIARGYHVGDGDKH